ncbi:hypothetical protein BCF55_0149 [Hydrogenivirga caldilitoris]|uniref:Cytochrome c554/c'-like protein n=1 Tax=Hydrogenivirga caldilitoris TaxID=246264 RepID=A0A497XNQ8_9AQUI|nr:hypothetical protein [Hydrogenivirga caldilitoris]RLJ69891.1 hypothetical protein BCF55_0149 [Hydrogenivirga caldilitoris]
MKLKRLFLVCLISGGVALSADKITLKKPPASLQKYYPPTSKKFEFLSNMHSMSMAFAGVRLNVNEGNWDKAKDWAVKLKDTYLNTSKMVPEWKEYFKPELADALVKAVESKNVDKFIEASRNFGQTCAKCHRDNEIAVKLVYHFPSFDTVKIEDPVEFMELETHKYMEKLANSMKALKVYLMQGDTDKAREAGSNFVERARQLRSMCSKCHTNKLSEEVMLGKEYEGALSRLENLLSSEKTNSEEVFKALGPIGATCTKCHNVHLIPALVQEAFEK